jgi:hypothetical protein
MKTKTSDCLGNYQKHSWGKTLATLYPYATKFKDLYNAIYFGFNASINAPQNSQAKSIIDNIRSESHVYTAHADHKKLWELFSQTNYTTSTSKVHEIISKLLEGTSLEDIFCAPIEIKTIAQEKLAAEIRYPTKACLISPPITILSDQGTDFYYLSTVGITKKTESVFEGTDPPELVAEKQRYNFLKNAIIEKKKEIVRQYEEIERESHIKPAIKEIKCSSCFNMVKLSVMIDNDPKPICEVCAQLAITTKQTNYPSNYKYIALHNLFRAEGSLYSKNSANFTKDK